MLLLDEPLGALDAKLRHSLRAQLTELQRRVGITFVFVTHDQEEALEMSDRLAVMSKGQIMQLGAPRDIYQFPQSEFVADFLGVANLMDVQVRAAVAGWDACSWASSRSMRRSLPGSRSALAAR